MLNNLDSKIKLGPTHNTLWDPLWKISTKMSTVEQQLLATTVLKRLHFIHHGGASYFNTHYVHTRLQHTLGVFALVAFFRPQDVNLRIAALLHDVGHAPFSHSIESIEGIDHRKFTTEIILSDAIQALLNEGGACTQSILNLVSGHQQSILRNTEGYLHLDHLDSWVRSAHAAGILMMPPETILKKLFVHNNAIQTDKHTAKCLFDLIVSEAQIHCSFSNIVANAVLRDLVSQLLKAGVLQVSELKVMTDGELEYILLHNSLTQAVAKKLFFDMGQFKVVKDGALEPGISYFCVEVDKLYLSMPLVDGVAIDQLSPQVAEKILQMEAFKGKYFVF